MDDYQLQADSMWLHRQTLEDGCAELLGPTIKPLQLSEWLNQEASPPDQIIEDCFDAGDKVAIIGSSKTKKSFFTTELAVCIATGREFAGLKVLKPRRVLIVQLELKNSHYHRRVSRQLQALGLNVEDVPGDQLFIVNGRGRGIDVNVVQQLAEKYCPEVLIIDPLYKILEGDENSAEHFKRTLAAFDCIAEETGAAVLYVHHDKKNVSGETDVRDRGAGSGVLSRDYDCCFALSRHEKSADALVLEPLLRNYPAKQPICLEWQDYRFVVSKLPPQVRRNSTRGSPKAQRKDAEYEKLVIDYVADANVIKKDAYHHLREFGATAQNAERILERMIATSKIIVTTLKGKRGGVKLLSLPGEAAS